MAFRYSKLKIIIFQGMSEERRIIMCNLLAFVSYTLAAMSGICFLFGSLAITVMTIKNEEEEDEQ